MRIRPHFTTAAFLAVIALAAHLHGSLALSESQQRGVHLFEVPGGEARGFWWPYKSAVGDHSSLALLEFNEEFQAKKFQLIPYSVCSPDSAIWVSANGPAPISWASCWVIFNRAATISFEIRDDDRKLVDVFTAEDCAPGLYHFEWELGDELEAATYVGQVVYIDKVLAEYRLPKR